MKKKTKNKIIALILLLIVYLYGIYTQPDTKTENKEKFSTKERQTEVINETSNNLKVTYLDVGQADSILIEENNEYIYIPSSWIYKSNEILVRLV